MDTYVLFFVVFGAVAGVGYCLILVFNPGTSATAMRLQGLVAGEAAPRAEDEKKKAPRKRTDTFLHQLILRLGQSARSSLEGGGGTDETAHRLAMAGYGLPRHAATYQGARLLIGLGLGTLGALVMLFSGASLGKMLLYAVGGLIFGMVAPNMWLGIKIKKRQEKISASLPNMVDLLVVCVEAGLGLDLAMSRVGQELGRSGPELSRELLALGRELAAGQSHEHALSRMAWRIGIGDVENLVAMLIQAERFGTSIAVSLRVFSDAFRTARRQRIEEAAAKTTIKLLFPLVFFIFPAIFVILLGPAAVNIIVGGVFK